MLLPTLINTHRLASPESATSLSRGLVSGAVSGNDTVPLVWQRGTLVEQPITVANGLLCGFLTRQHLAESRLVAFPEQLSRRTMEGTPWKNPFLQSPSSKIERVGLQRQWAHPDKSGEHWAEVSRWRAHHGVRCTVVWRTRKVRWGLARNNNYTRAGGRKGSLALLDVSSRRLNGSNSNKRWSNVEKSVKFRAIETDILRGQVLMVQYIWVNTW